MLFIKFGMVGRSLRRLAIPMRRPIGGSPSSVTQISLMRLDAIGPTRDGHCRLGQVRCGGP